MQSYTSISPPRPPFPPSAYPGTVEEVMEELPEFAPRYANFDIILTHHFDLLAHFSALPHLTRAVCCALLGAYADWVLIGAWNPMLCPIWGFQVRAAVILPHAR